jgi:hypothetical protein
MSAGEKLGWQRRLWAWITKGAKRSWPRQVWFYCGLLAMVGPIAIGHPSPVISVVGIVVAGSALLVPGRGRIAPPFRRWRKDPPE